MATFSGHRSNRYMVIIMLPFLMLLPSTGNCEEETTFTGAPRTEDGRFTNLRGEIGHGSLGDRVPFMLRRFGTYFRRGEGAPEVKPNDGAFLRDNAKHSVPTVTWVGHSTLLVQMGHLSFLTDPIWSSIPSPVPLLGPRRYVGPGVDMNDLPPIDFVVISHNHYDHLDLPTLRALAKRSANTLFLVPLGNGGLLKKNGIKNIKEMDWGETTEIEEITIYCLPTQHWSKRSFADDNKALWSSWAVTSQDSRFYFAGDTGYFDGFKKIGNQLGPFDLVAVPIGAYEPQAMMFESHMDPEQAVDAVIELKGQRAIGIHFGTFDLSDEPLFEPPQRFTDAARSAALDAWIFKIGETREF